MACWETLNYIALVVSNSFQRYGLQPTRLLCPRAFPGKNIVVGYHDLLQEILPTQESNLHFLCLLPWQAGSLPLAAPRKESLIWQKWDRLRSEGRKLRLAMIDAMINEQILYRLGEKISTQKVNKTFVKFSSVASTKSSLVDNWLF